MSGKRRIAVLFSMICVSVGSKSTLPKAAGAEVPPSRQENLHAAVAPSTFASQNAKKLKVSEHFLEVQTSKNCTPLWREAHVQVKMLKI